MPRFKDLPDLTGIPFTPSTPPEEEQGDFRRGLGDALLQIPQTAGGAIGLIGDAIGSKGMRDYGMDMYDNYSERIQKGQKEADSLSHVIDNGGEGAGTFLKHGLGYVAGQAATAIATGGVGGMIGKQIAKTAVRELAAKGLEDQAAKLAIRSGIAGAATTAGASNLMQEAGSIYPDMVEEAQKTGRPITQADLARAGLSAVGAAAVDTAMEGVNIGKVAHGGRQMVKDAAGELVPESMLKAARREVPMGMLREGATEGIQTGIERFGAQKDLTTAEAIRDYVDSIGLGMLGGGAAGAGASVMPQHAPEKVPEAGPLSRAANVAVEQQTLLLENKQDPLIAFPDGSVGKQADVDAYLASLPEEDRIAAHAKLMGLGEAQNFKPKAKPTAADADPEKQHATALENIAKFSERPPYTLDQAQAVADKADRLGHDFMVVPHASNAGFAVVPSKFITPQLKKQFAPLNAGDKARLPSPDMTAPNAPLLVDSQGEAAPATYGDLQRSSAMQAEAKAKTDAEAQRRLDLGTPVPYGTKAQPKAETAPATPAPSNATVENPVPEGMIGRKDGGAFKAKIAAQKALKAAADPALEIRAVEGGFALAKKETNADDAPQNGNSRQDAPAAESANSGPFADQGAANRAMLAAAEATGKVHEVVQHGDLFHVQPLQENANAAAAPDVSEPVRNGRPSGDQSAAENRADQPVAGTTSSAMDDGRNAATGSADRAAVPGSNPAADTKPALTDTPASIEKEAAPAKAETPKKDDTPAIDAKTLASKTLPEMSDAELVAGLQHYGPDHKRHGKIIKEMQKRGIPPQMVVTPADTKTVPPALRQKAKEAGIARSNEIHSWKIKQSGIANVKLAILDALSTTGETYSDTDAVADAIFSEVKATPTPTADTSPDNARYEGSAEGEAKQEPKAPVTRKPAEIVDNTATNPGEYLVRDAGHNLARFKMGEDGKVSGIKHFFDSSESRDHALQAIDKFKAERAEKPSLDTSKDARIRRLTARADKLEAKADRTPEENTELADIRETLGSQQPAAPKTKAKAEPKPRAEEVDPRKDDNAPQWAGNYDRVLKGEVIDGWGKPIGKNPDGDSIYEAGGMRAVVTDGGQYTVIELAHKPKDERYAEFKTAEELGRDAKATTVEAKPAVKESLTAAAREELKATPLADQKSPEVSDKLSAATKARNDLMEMEAKLEAQGRIADDRLIQKIRQQKAVIKALDAEAAPKPAAANPELDAAKKDAMDALAGIAELFGKNAKANITEQQEEKLFPLLSKLIGAVIRMGKVKFTDAAREAVALLRTHAGDEVANQIDIDHLQGAYIAVAKKYADKGTDSASTVIGVNSLDEIQSIESGEKAPTMDKQPEKVNGQPDLPAIRPLDQDAEQGNQQGVADGRPDGNRPDGALGQKPAGNGASNGNKRNSRPSRARDGEQGDSGQGGLFEGRDERDGRNGTGGSGLAHDGAGSGGPVVVPGRANFHIADPESLVGGSPRVRFARNKAALETYAAISEEGRAPSEEELATMAGYIGWGSFGQELFNGSWDKPNPKPEWAQQDAWLRNHLGEEAWKSAQASIINAHYTDPITVKTMWDMVQAMGFTGGRVLEPSMGIGNFFGMMPRDLMAKSQLTGIELDTTTGGMAKLLYPEANIQIKGYQDSKTADNFYDLVIGNWPFAKDGPSDRRYMKLDPSLHDYFFLKALDQTRPGGLVFGITSAGTMDKKGLATRRELAKKAELVASFRLPSGAFEKYAGTAVVTDMIVLRKRETPLSDASGESWIDLKEVPTRSGTPVAVNAYYAAHPENVLGTLNFGHGSTYGRPSMIVDRPADLEQRMAAIPAKLPKDAYQPAKTKEAISYITNNTADREGSITVSGDGLYVVRGERLAPLAEVVKYALKDPARTAAREAQVRSLIDMRRTYGELITAERNGADNTEAVRKTLNQQYQAFTKQYGSLADSDGLNILYKAKDPFYASLAALEHNGEPAQILTQPTTRGKKVLDKPTISDAFVMARNQSLDVNLQAIADAAGKPVADVERELLDSGAVFKTPAETYEVADVYLSGNVRRKLREAEEAATAGADMARNIAALKKVIPKDVPYFQIEAKLGAPWIKADHYADFLSHLLAMDKVPADIRFSNGSWKVRFTDDSINRRPEATTQWGVPYTAGRFDRLVSAAMNNRTITIKRKDADGNTVVDETATKETNEKITKLREKFSEWVWDDGDRRLYLEKNYNEVMNAIALPKYDGSFLEFNGMALRRGEDAFALRSHQVNAIWRGLANKKGMYGHEVGTGKTYTMGGLAVESRRYGIAKKPLLFAHNANSATVAREINDMYPGAKVLYIDNLAPNEIDVTMRKIANDDWDAVVVPHSLVDRFALTEKTLMEIAAEDIQAMEDEAFDAAEDEGVKLTRAMMDDDEEMKKVRSRTAKELVKARNAIIKSIKDMALRSSKENAVSFEDLGVDMVIVDEVQEFKKPPIATKMQMKGLNKGTSNQSINMRFLTDYVKRQNGGTGVHTFTGTYITNTLTELYNQMRYVMDEEMKRDGIKDWDSWFNTFADSTNDVELTDAGEYEAVTRLASFVNVAELRRISGQFLDIVFADDMPEFAPRPTESGKTLTDKSLTDAERRELTDGRTEKPVGRPYKRIITDVAPMGSAQEAMQREFVELANQFRNATKKERMEMMRSGHPASPLLVGTGAANAGVDPRLVDMKAPDEPNSKVNRVVKNVAGIYRQNDKTTQVVFLERGYTDFSMRTKNGVKVKVPKFNLVKDMVDKLVAQGIPRDQIAIVDGNVSKEKRKAIADAMNNLDIRVVIGNTKTLGVGVNMQKYLRAMHHMDAPWMPGDLEQRNGRGHRQGNTWNTVQEIRYITERLDGRRWQVLTVKDRFIKAFLKADESVRVIDGDAVDMEEGESAGDLAETLSEAAGDPRILMREKFKADITKLETRERLHTVALSDARRKVKDLESQIENTTQSMGLMQKDYDQYQAGRENFTATIGKTTYDERPAADAALKELAKASVSKERPNAEIGTVHGFPITAQWHSWSPDEPTIAIEGAMPHYADVSIASIEGQLRALGKRIEGARESISQAQDSIPRLQAMEGTPFAQQKQLDAKKKMLADLEVDLQANPIPAPSWLRFGAPVGSLIYVDGKPRAVEGHTVTDEGYFVVTEQGRVPYMDAKDDNGMPLYEAHAFTAPKVVTKDEAGKAGTMGNQGEAGGSEADRALFDQVKAGTTAADVLTHIIKNGTPDQIALAKHLQSLGINPKVKFDQSEGRNFATGDGHYTAGYAPATDTVLLFENGRVMQDLLHEMVHSATAKAVRNGSATANRLDSLYRHAKQHADFAAYGLENSDELLAEAFTNPSFQAALEAMPALPGSKLASAWQWFKSIVRAALGLPENKQSLLDQVLDAGRTLMAENAGSKDIDFADTMAGTMGTVSDTVLNVLGKAGLNDAMRNKVSDYLTSEKTIGAWAKTVGNPYHLAQTNKYYKPVYDAIQHSISAISDFANAAADQAPTLLPKLEGIADLKKKPVSKADNAAVGKAVFQGTLDKKIYSEAELKAQGLTPAQITMYREFRAAVNHSLDDLAKTSMLHVAGKAGEAVTAQVMAAADTAQAATLLADHLQALGDEINADAVRDMADKTAKLKAEGYAPLSRFGEHTLYVTGKNGEQLFFGMYESAAEMNKMARDMAAIYPEATIAKGVASKEGHKMFNGISPDTIELFANITGLEKDPLFQDYLKLVKNNNSAMKRLIHRKGIAGFSEDATRVLASFITSNARAASRNLFAKTIDRHVEAIPQSMGDVKDYAINQVGYLKNPTEEAAGIRGMLFTNFIGGSIASAIVNMTQPVMQTFPYLSQFGGAAQSASLLASAMKTAATTPDPSKITDKALREAMIRAIHEGAVSPQDIHNLQADAMRNSKGLEIGGKQIVSPFMKRKFALVWGGFFSLAEQFNRKATFIAAFKIGQGMSQAALQKAGVSDAYEFAVKAINETQGVYNKGNKAPWARGAVGATLMTFKQYTTSYLEFLKRLPPKERAIALAVLVVASGVGGLPFSDDLDDLIDTIAEALGYNLNAKKAKANFLAKVIGKQGAEFVLHGFSGALGVPIDVSSRLGFGNILPATGVFKKSNTHKESDLFEIAGAAGGFAQKYYKGAGHLLAGEPMAALKDISASASTNAVKGIEMWQSGQYKDESGRNVQAVSGLDAVMKGIGFQPSDVARGSRAAAMVRQDINAANAIKAEIQSNLAESIVKKDPQGMAKAIEARNRWNANNPDTPIALNLSAARHKAREMMLSRNARLTKQAPKSFRLAAQAELEAE